MRLFHMMTDYLVGYAERIEFAIYLVLNTDFSARHALQECTARAVVESNSVKDYIIISDLIRKIERKNEHINPTDTNRVNNNTGRPLV